MDNFTISAWLGKAFYAIALAGTLGAGTTLISTAERTAVLEAQNAASSTRLERIENKHDRLIERTTQP